MADLPGIYYGEYLQLDKILNAQELESTKHGGEAHDEMVFIVTHQVYELWFKQIVHELTAVINVFDDSVVREKKISRALHLLSRIKTIQWVLIHQIDVIETITPLDFLEFRDLLVPASGFQSTYFKRIEIMLGLKRHHRIAADCEFFKTRLRGDDLEELDELEKEPSLLELTDRWLTTLPFGKLEGFDFWEQYRHSVDKMLASDQEIIEGNPTLTKREKEFQINDLIKTRQRFDSLLDKEKFDKMRDDGKFRLSHSGFLAALFIHLYRDEPMLYIGFRFLTLLVDIDGLFTTWRQRHAVMVQRMLGTKIGTGGSSGHDYLNATTQQNRVFIDLYNISTFIIPREDLPELPEDLRQDLRSAFRGNGTE